MFKNNAVCSAPTFEGAAAGPLPVLHFLHMLSTCNKQRAGHWLHADDLSLLHALYRSAHTQKCISNDLRCNGINDCWSFLVLRQRVRVLSQLARRQHCHISYNSLRELADVDDLSVYTNAGWHCTTPRGTRTHVYIHFALSSNTGRMDDMRNPRH